MAEPDRQDRIRADLQEAIKARDALRKNVLRSLKAALDKERIDAGGELDGPAVVAVVKRQHKQRLESAETYAASGSDALAGNERAEAEIVAVYLPEQLDKEEIVSRIEAAIASTSAQTARDVGKVMGALSADLAGRADMKEVAAIVRGKLAQP